MKELDSTEVEKLNERIKFLKKCCVKGIKKRSAQTTKRNLPVIIIMWEPVTRTKNKQKNDSNKKAGANRTKRAQRKPQRQ